MQNVKHISVSINCPADKVYEFASNPANLPKWATGLGGSITNVNGEWIADSPLGKIKIRFAPQNTFGVLDHNVILETGQVFHNPMRVVPNGEGSEVIFTLIQHVGMTEEKFGEDIGWVTKDLGILKKLLEGQQ